MEGAVTINSDTDIVPPFNREADIDRHDATNGIFTIESEIQTERNSSHQLQPPPYSQTTSTQADVANNYLGPTVRLHQNEGSASYSRAGTSQTQQPGHGSVCDQNIRGVNNQGPLTIPCTFVTIKQARCQVMLSTVVSIFCFPPLGLPALVFSCLALRSAKKKDHFSARSQLKASRVLSFVGLAIGPFFVVFLFVYLLTVFLVVRIF